MSALKGLLPIPLSEVISDGSLKVDLYLQMNGEKYLKVSHDGRSFSAARAKSYLNKGVRVLYMLRDDLAAHVGFKIGVKATPESEVQTQVGHAREVLNALTASLEAGGLRREHLQEAADTVINVVNLMAANLDTLRLLEALDSSGAPMDHGLAAAMWSCLLARQVGWAGQATYFRLAVSALFHDIGENEEGGESARAVASGHTVRGRDMILTMAILPEDAATVALQHHETACGTGYPYGLSLHQLHPFSRLVTIADKVAEMLRPRGNGLGQCYATLMEHQRDYDPAILNALGNILIKSNEASKVV